MLRTIEKIPLTAILAVTAGAYLLLLVPYWNVRWDSAVYISLAQSLANGEGYVYMGYAHTKYPPGLPLLLAPIEFFFGHHYLLMRLLITVCAVGAIGLTWCLIRPLYSRRIAFAVCVMTASSYALVAEVPVILSDIPYMLVSLAALVAANQYTRNPTKRVLLWVTVLILVATSLRLIGVTLAMAMLIGILFHPGELALSRRVRDAAVLLLLMGLATGLWVGRNAMVTEQLPSELREALSYQEELIAVDPNDANSSTIDFSTFRSRLGKNVSHYERLLVDIVTGKQVENRWLVHLIAFFWLAGWLLALIQQRSVMAFYTFLYICVYLAWPALQGERFLVPVLPMIICYALQVPLMIVRGVTRWVSESGGPVSSGMMSARAPELMMLMFITVSFFLVNLPSLISIVSAERQSPYYRGGQGEYVAALSWIRDETPEDSLIITDLAPIAYLLSERKTLSAPLFGDDHEVFESIILNGGTHVITNNWGVGRYYINPVIESHPDRFEPIKVLGSNTIYRVNVE
jgi:hypothetical protein